MRPSRIFVLPNFPIGSTGKVDRKKLRNLVS
jgi:non-ribosomal peptide synthetase component E (peptide arylation enzyme)